MTDRLERLDYYTLLGVEPGVGEADVKQAFRRFAKRYHPDRFAGAPPDKIERASQIYRRGSEAFQVLRDPVSRQAYDRILGAGKLRLDADEHERARHPKPAAPRKRPPPIRSPQALAFYRRAAEAAQTGRWRDAWRALRRAVEIEPGNPLLDARLQQVERRLRTR